MKRIILHIDMDYFFAQIEERENPRFKGKPVVVGADPKNGKGRGVVATCNYIAREYGIHSALPISKAFKLCRKAIFLPVNMELYQEVSENIMEIIKKYSSDFEQVSLDEAYLDISFLGNYKEAKELTKKLKSEILKKEKLTSTIGIGPNKLIAKIAAQKAKPDGFLIVRSSESEKFLEPFDIEKIPGIGPKTAQRLRNLGVNKIKELKRLSRKKLVDMFGKWGDYIYNKVRGIDREPVSNNEEIKSIGKEYTFEKDTRDPEIIFKIFGKIIEGVYKELLESNFQFRTITIVCRFSGFETHTKSKTFKDFSDDFDSLRKESKILLLKFIVENPKPIRLVGLRLSNFISKK